MDNKLPKVIAQGNNKKTRDANKRNVNISITQSQNQILTVAYKYYFLFS
jgi:hypothetical protein